MGPRGQQGPEAVVSPSAQGPEEDPESLESSEKWNPH